MLGNFDCFPSIDRSNVRRTEGNANRMSRKSSGGNRDAAFRIFSWRNILRDFQTCLVAWFILWLLQSQLSHQLHSTCGQWTSTHVEQARWDQRSSGLLLRPSHFSSGCATFEDGAFRSFSVLAVFDIAVSKRRTIELYSIRRSAAFNKLNLGFHGCVQWKNHPRSLWTNLLQWVSEFILLFIMATGMP